MYVKRKDYDEWLISVGKNPTLQRDKEELIYFPGPCVSIYGKQLVSGGE